MAADQAEDAPGSARPDLAIDTTTPPRGAQKVELDLDDAPFLEDEEEAAPEPPKEEPKPLPEDKPAEAKPPLSKKKKLILLGAAVLVLLIAAGVAAKIFLFKGGAPAEAPAAKEEKAEHKANATADNASEAALPQAPALLVKLEPFWVEQKGQGDEVRFLIVRMILASNEQALASELKTKLLPIRNAVFYYLKNKDVQFLADEHNAEKLKGELLLVVNQYMDMGKFDSVMFEEYVVK